MERARQWRNFGVRIRTRRIPGDWLLMRDLRNRYPGRTAGKIDVAARHLLADLPELGNAQDRDPGHRACHRIAGPYALGEVKEEQWNYCEQKKRSKLNAAQAHSDTPTRTYLLSI